jgi:excisionase family DNA binding protein
MAYENITKLLTTAEVAGLLGVQLRWVQTLIQKKRLKASKPGGRDYLIDAGDLASLQIRKPGRPRGSVRKRTSMEPSQQGADSASNDVPRLSDGRHPVIEGDSLQQYQSDISTARERIRTLEQPIGN